MKLFSVLLYIRVTAAMTMTTAEAEVTDPVLSLNDTTFQDFIDENDLVLVMFHATWSVFTLFISKEKLK